MWWCYESPSTSDSLHCVGELSCSANALCKYEPGRFYCECWDGFDGDGITCNGEKHFDILALVLVYRYSPHYYQHWYIGTLYTATSTGILVLSLLLPVLVYRYSPCCYQYWYIGTLYTATSTGISVLSTLLLVLVFLNKGVHPPVTTRNRKQTAIGHLDVKIKHVSFI